MQKINNNDDSDDGQIFDNNYPFSHGNDSGVEPDDFYFNCNYGKHQTLKQQSSFTVGQTKIQTSIYTRKKRMRSHFNFTQTNPQNKGTSNQ